MELSVDDKYRILPFYAIYLLKTYKDDLCEICKSLNNIKFDKNNRVIQIFCHTCRANISKFTTCFGINGRKTPTCLMRCWVDACGSIQSCCSECFKSSIK